MEIAITFEQLIALGMFCVGFLGLLFGVFKFFSAQIHARISKEKADVLERIENIEENYARRTELLQMGESIKTILNDVKNEGQRVNDRMDDLFKWLMNNMGRNKKDV